MSTKTAAQAPAECAPEAAADAIPNGNRRSHLMELLRVLRHDETGQEIVLNEILRDFVDHNMYESAERIIANSTLHQPYRSTNQAARFFYFVGLTRAIRLDYVEANACLLQAIRKAPERALGFRIAATKLSLVVQLLIGEIPPRSEFLQQGMKEALHPYLLLTSCVRFGHLARFLSITMQHQKQFQHDRTYSLILRVRQNVIKTGLRRICKAYTRIPLQDLCARLALDNPEDAEYIVAKAIRDGVIDASIDHKNGHVVSADTVDVYSTTEPLLALQRRIQFCNFTHDEARKAMRYELPDQTQDKQDIEDLTRALEDDQNEEDMDFGDGI